MCHGSTQEGMTFTAERWRPATYSEKHEIAFQLNSEESLVLDRKNRGRKYSGLKEVEKQKHSNKGTWMIENQ